MLLLTPMKEDNLAYIVVALYGLVSAYFWAQRTSRGSVLEASDQANVIIFRKMLGTPTADEEEQRLLDERRRVSFQELASVWCYVLDLFLLSLFLIQACGILEPMVSFLPFLFGVAVGSEILRRVAQDKDIVTPARLDRDLTIMSILVFISTLGMPREFVPACYLARTLCFSFTCSRRSNKMNVLLAPFYVLAHWITQSPDGPPERVEFHIISEIISVTFMTMLMTNLDNKEHKLATASVELETKVKQVKEAEREGGAAQRLLSVTCDASVRLTHDLQIQMTSQSLLDLLMCNFGRASKTTLDGTPFLRYIAADDQQRFIDFVAESSTAAPAGSLHVSMKDSSGVSFGAELFHVTVPGLAEEPEHLIGITNESNAADRLGRMENLCPSSDMRHVIGFGVGSGRSHNSPPSQKSAGQLSGSKASSGSQTSVAGGKGYTGLKGLAGIRLVLDTRRKNDYPIRRLTFTFADLQSCDADLLPNLLEWLKPHYRGPVSSFIDQHVDACQRGACVAGPSHEMQLVKILSPFPGASVLLTKSMRVIQMVDYEDQEAERFMEMELTQLFAR